MLVTHQLVLENFAYDPATGVLSRKGRVVGFKHGTGYLALSFCGQRFLVHRFIWFYMTGEWPDVIDHINRVRDDNRWENLRNGTHLDNAKNTTPGRRSPGRPTDYQAFRRKLLEDFEFSQKLKARMTRRQAV